MLLKLCYVQGFGKLQDFTYEFDEGLNVICTENGWGKTTFAAFLRAMFYGLPAAGSRTKLEEAERRKYRPWNGGVMGGYLVFSVNGKEYKAERTFGKKEAEDTFRLIDLSTNLDSADYSAELGKELFGLDKEAYSRSTYLPQNKIFDGGMNDSIGKKLGKMAEGEEESGNFDKAYNNLDELRKKYIPDRQKEEKGYVAELTRAISETESRLEACRRKEEAAKPWREKEREAVAEKKKSQDELAECRKQLEVAAGYEALAAKKRHYTEICKREETLKLKKDSMEGLFPTGVPTAEQLKECRHMVEEAGELSGEVRSYRLSPEEQDCLAELRHTFESGVPTREQIEECIRAEAEGKEASQQAELLLQQVTIQEKADRKKGLLLVVWGMVGTISGIWGLVFELVLKQEGFGIGRTICMIFGTICLLLGAVAYKDGSGRKKKREELEQNLAAAEGAKEQGLSLLRRYNQNTSVDIGEGLYRLADAVHRYEELSAKEAKYNRSLERRDALRRRGGEFLAAYHMDTEDLSGSLSVLERRRQEFTGILKDYEEAVKLREYFEKETPPESFAQFVAPEMGYGSLQEREKELLSSIARLEETEKDCRNRAEAYEEEAEDYGELSETCLELNGRLEAKKQEHFYITETLKCLKKAKEQFSSRYMKGLSEGFDRYVTLLGGNDLEKTTDGHYTGIHTDVNLNVQVTVYGEDKELGYFSTGFRDYIGLCMRFALVDAMFTEEKPFLVLDDPFVNLDKEKLDRCLAFLRKASGEYQILYLVCHDSRA